MSYYHSPKARELLTSLAAIVCPRVPDPRKLAAEINAHVELSMRAFPGPARTALIAGLRTYDEGARLYPPTRGRPARDLDGELGGRYFASWWRSSIGLQREFARGVKGLICLAYYETQTVKDHIGYTPEAWIKQVTARRLEVYSDAIEAQKQAILAPEPLGPLGPLPPEVPS